MVAILIKNEKVNVCVKADKVESTELSHILTFLPNNIWGKFVIQSLQGAAFTILNQTNGNLIISLPLEIWHCTAISENEYRKLRNSQMYDCFNRIKEIINYEKTKQGNCHLMVSYSDGDKLVTNTLMISVKIQAVNGGIAANITMVDNNENNITFYLGQGMKLNRIFNKFSTIDELYMFLALLFVEEHADKFIHSIDEVMPSFCEF